MCDVELVGRGASEGVMAHGLFLALASPVMRSMVQWEANKAATNSEGTIRAGKSHLVISLPETDPVLLKMLIDCIYGGRLSQSCSISDIIGLGKMARLGSAMPAAVTKNPLCTFGIYFFFLLFGAVALRSRRRRVILTGHHTRREAGGHV
jgi:hypothetical protein